MIITTNLPLKEIKNETMLDKKRIYDRILEMCTPMYVGGASKREAIASMKMEKAKTLLNTNRGEEDSNESYRKNNTCLEEIFFKCYPKQLNITELEKRD